MQELVANDGGDGSDDGNDGTAVMAEAEKQGDGWGDSLPHHVEAATATTTEEFGKFFCEIVPLNQIECLLTFV